MTFRVEFETDNAEFQDGLPTAVAGIHCIFESIRKKLRDGQKSGSVRDSNGNTIGQWEWTD